MRAFKGVSKDGTNNLGKGKIKYEAGRNYSEKRAKTVAAGFHCCENPMECLTYYHLDSDRFFVVEAGGSIDEDDGERIACTELKVIRELTLAEFAMESMLYIVSHPKRKKWEQTHTGVKVAKDKAEATMIAIARGKNPMVKGTTGTFLGLIQEDRNGNILHAGMKKVDGKKIRENVWYTFDRWDGSIREACDWEVDEK